MQFYHKCLVKIYDGIQSFDQIQQPATLANFSRIPELKGLDVEKTLRLAVEDGLLILGGPNVYTIPSCEKSPIFRFKHDSFCHTCHGSGVVLECESCWRVSHAACCPVDAPTTRGKFLCSMCRQLRSAKPSNLDLKQLNRLLIFIICILRERFKEHFLDPDRIGNAIYRNFMFKYVGFETVEERIINNYYKTPLEFLSDIQTLFHCFVLASGSEFSTTADLLYNYAHYELDELEICPTCYLLSNTQPHNWFSMPCKPPHRLVFAKQKGYSYWPAKVVQSIRPDDDSNEGDVDSYDVRYFGGNHERAFIEPDCLKPIENDVSKLVPKRTVAFNKAMDELAILQKYLSDGYPTYSKILDSLWHVNDWRLEIENEKLRKAQLTVKPAGYKGKKGRPKGSGSYRSTPTPTNSSAANDGDSRDAIGIDLVSESSSATMPEKDVVQKGAPTRRSARSEAAEKSIPGDKHKLTGESTKSTARTGQRSSLPSPPSAEPSVKKPTLTPLGKASKGQEGKNASQENMTTPKKEIKAEMVSKTPTGSHQKGPPSYSSVSKGEQTSPLTPPKPQGPCPPGSLCAEAYERKLSEAKYDFELKLKHLQEKLDSERRNELALAERRFSEEIVKFQKQQVEEIAAVKKKQWCVNCSQEAFFPCCWNTAYCSQNCQQEHWYHEHKRICRRRRNQETSSASNSTTTGGGTQIAAAATAATGGG